MKNQYVFTLSMALLMFYSCNDDHEPLSSSESVYASKFNAFIAEAQTWLERQDPEIQNGIRRLGEVHWKHSTYILANGDTPEMLNLILKRDKKGRIFLTFLKKNGQIKPLLYALAPKKEMPVKKKFIKLKKDFVGDIHLFDLTGQFRYGYRVDKGKIIARLVKKSQTNKKTEKIEATRKQEPTTDTSLIHSLFGKS